MFQKIVLRGICYGKDEKNDTIIFNDFSYDWM